MTAMDIHQRNDLIFPQSLPEFQRQFPNDAAALPILSEPAGLTALSAHTAAWSPNPTALSPDRVLWNAARAAAKLVS